MNTCNAAFDLVDHVVRDKGIVHVCEDFFVEQFEKEIRKGQPSSVIESVGVHFGEDFVGEIDLSEDLEEHCEVRRRL